MIRLLRSRYALIPLFFTLITLALVSHRMMQSRIKEEQPPSPKGPATKLKQTPSSPEDKPHQIKQHPLYKPPSDSVIPPPLPEYFPVVANAKSAEDMPPVPSWNRPPVPHVPEKTPLYIGFTRYWPLLQQVVVSYIAAGWPPEDIYVVENTGTYDANKRGQLSSQNPFYLDYHRLTKVFGVNVITMPSLQTFAQLQNFYLSEAINKNYSYYFWGHMDVLALPHEEGTPYRSLYQIAVDTIRESMKPDYGKDEKTGGQKLWAIRFFAYDWLALFNTKAMEKVGGWDSTISYYGTDCDMYSRIKFNDLSISNADAGDVFDVSESLENLDMLFRRRPKGSGSTTTAIQGSNGQAESAPGVAAAAGDVSASEGSVGGEMGDMKAALAQAAAKEKRMIGQSSKDKGPGNMAGDELDLLLPDYDTAKADKSGSSSSTLKAGTSSSSNSGSSSGSSHSKPGSTAELQTYLDTTEEDERGGVGYRAFKAKLEAMQQAKRDDPYRNSWQLKQRGGQGEPYYYDADGWETALQMTTDTGMAIVREKWGHWECDIEQAGLKEGDQWRVEHDWE